MARRFALHSVALPVLLFLGCAPAPEIWSDWSGDVDLTVYRAMTGAACDPIAWRKAERSARYQIRCGDGRDTTYYALRYDPRSGDAVDLVGPVARVTDLPER